MPSRVVAVVLSGPHSSSVLSLPIVSARLMKGILSCDEIEVRISSNISLGLEGEANLAAPIDEILAANYCAILSGLGPIKELACSCE